MFPFTLLMIVFMFVAIPCLMSEEFRTSLLKKWIGRNNHGTEREEAAHKKDMEKFEGRK
jgi:hypothetical protein